MVDATQGSLSPSEVADFMGGTVMAICVALM